MSTRFPPLLGLANRKLSCRFFSIPCMFHRRAASNNAAAVTQLNGETTKPFHEIPGPPIAPVFGSLLSFLLAKPKDVSFGKFVLMKQFTDVEKYGKIFKGKAGGIYTVSIADPEAASAIFRLEPKYPKRFDSPLIDHYRAERKTIPGVFFADGSDWYKYRSVISKKILRPREVAEFAAPFNDISTDFLDRVSSIRGPIGSEHENEIQELDNELFKWSFESVAYMLFERRFGCLGESVNQDAQEFIKSVGGFQSTIVPVTLLPVWFYKIYETKTYKEFVHHFDNMYRYADVFITEKVEELEKQGKLHADVQDGERVDFFRFLLSSKKITKEDLMASVIDLFFAGVDTTSNTMQWVLYLMGTHPEEQDKLYREVSSVLKRGEAPTAATIHKLPYLRAWLKETLRMYPPLSALPRQLPHDIDLLGYNIPGGTNLSILYHYMGRDNGNFEDAAQFKPERWLRDEMNQTAEDFHAFASIPFGFGTRMCVGRRIAELELHLLMIKTVQRFIITYPHTEQVGVYMRGITIPDRPVRVRFTDRLKPEHQ